MAICGIVEFYCLALFEKGSNSPPVIYAYNNTLDCLEMFHSLQTEGSFPYFFKQNFIVTPDHPLWERSINRVDTSKSFEDKLKSMVPRNKRQK